MGNTEHDRIREAYIRMAERARYRPQAPSDGLGNIQLSDSQLADPKLLESEASAYAERFIEEENTLQFHIGVSKFPNRAVVYVVEAARRLCAGSDPGALVLLEMAIEEVNDAIRTRRRDASVITPIG